MRRVAPLLLVPALILLAVLGPRLLGGHAASTTTPTGQRTPYTAPTYSMPTHTPSATSTTAARPTGTATGRDDEDAAATPDPASDHLAKAFVYAYLAGATNARAPWLAQLRPLVSDNLYAGLSHTDQALLPPGPAARVDVAVIAGDGGGSWVVQAADGSRFTVVLSTTVQGLRVVNVTPGTP